MAQLDCATSFMIRVFFGSPGAGKTTLAVAFAKRFKRRGYKSAWLNFEFHDLPKGCYEFSTDLLGYFTPPEHAYIAIDEAGIDYNNRSYKTMSKEAIRYFKLHRHYAVDIDVFSQSWDDMDVTIRRLANELWHIVRIGPFTACRLVTRYVTVDKDSHQIVDGYKQASKFAILTSWLSKFCPVFSRKWMLIRRRKYYKHFDSWTRPNIPIFPQYESESSSQPA